MKSGIWAPLALAWATTALTACGEAPPAAPAGPQAPAGVTVSNGRLSLPPVAGNPGAVYFDVANGGTADVTIRTVAVAGAQSAVLHSMTGEGADASMQELLQLPIKAGETTKFEPGKLHVMAMGLADTVAAGGTTDVTLSFVNGDKLTFPAQIAAAGDAR